MKNILSKSKLLILLVISSFSLTVHADDDKGLFERWTNSNKAGVSAVKFQQYNDLCGRCHFPYQAGLLPAVSWQRLMINLDDHFGQPVQLTAVESRTMMRYLLDNSAGHVNDKISTSILKSLEYDPIPIRITQTPYWKDKHKKIADTEINKRSFQCDYCHQDAHQGKYDTHSINYSGYNQKTYNTVDLKM